MNVPSTAIAGKTFTISWQSGSKTVSGDWIGLFVKNVYTASWYTYVSGGLLSGTVTATMPNSPGTQYNFIFVRSGYANSYSSLITCTSSSGGSFDTGHDSVTPAEPLLPTLTIEPEAALEPRFAILREDLKAALDTPVPTLTDSSPPTLRDAP